MAKYTFWIIAFCLPTVAVLTESLLPEDKIYVTDALSQNAFVIKTWTYIGSSLNVTVIKGNKTLLTALFDGVVFSIQESQLLLEYNNSTKDVSLLLNNVTRGDEGIYQISTSINTAEGSDIKDSTWKVQLNVLEPGEIRQGYAGEDILITEFVQESISFPRLHHNDQLIAVYRGSVCDVSTNSPFYGRIRCSKDMDNYTTRIEIKRVTENDTGLYTLERERSLPQRSFLNITGTYTKSPSELIIVSLPDRFDGASSDQTSNITLPTTVISRAVVNQVNSEQYNPQHECDPETLLPEYIIYVTDALSHNAFVIKTWTYIGSSLYVTVKKENETLLSVLFDGVSSNGQESRLLLEYNNSTKEVSLLLNNVTRGDEGVYNISASIYTAEVSDTIDNIWKVQLHVLEPSEIKQGYAGETLVITECVKESLYVPQLYHNYQLIAVLRDSDCDVSTNSRFYGRIRCLKNKDYNTTRIEIKNVNENDTGLFTVETEGSLTQRSFLSITGTYTNSPSELIIVTLPDRFNGVNSYQSSNITLPTTVITRAVVNQVNLDTESELIHILPITTVAVFAIILFFGSLIWIQRRNNKRFKAVQRIVLETMETASSAAFSTLGRCPHTPSREELCTGNSNSLRNTFQIPAPRLQYPSPKVSTSDHISCHNKRQQLDDDYYKFDVTDTILKICESCNGSNSTILAECHECPASLTDACPFPSDAFSATDSEVHLDRRIFIANGQCQLTRNTEATYAKVKKLSSINNVKAGASCKNGYEMVDISQSDNPTNGVQDAELVLASETPNTTCLGISTSIVDLDPGTKVEEANTIIANIINNASAENVMSYDEENALSGRKEEQGEQDTIHIIVCNHDANNPK